ncbi:hypothetical protein ABLO27_08305 [Roseibium sp. SCPC15]|uniref:hypothetical protein n=1 Tax=Roseibium sp. SCP15 TaxID=3141376 RepID=UPI0033378EAF
MPKIIHPIAGAVAFLTIATFWLSTVTVELIGTEAQVTAVKTAIPWGLLVLVPAMIAVGGSGFFLAGKRRGGVLGLKARRMPIIGANGVLVLVPAALFLAFKANAGEFDSTFYTVQALELIAGATNLTLMGLSMRDGFKLSGRFRRRETRS